MAHCSLVIGNCSFVISRWPHWPRRLAFLSGVLLPLAIEVGVTVTEMTMLSIAGMLAMYLFIRVRRRARRKAQQERLAYQRYWASRGLDAPALSGRVQRLRHDYASAVHGRSHNACKRRGLIALARRA